MRQNDRSGSKLRTRPFDPFLPFKFDPSKYHILHRQVRAKDPNNNSPVCRHLVGTYVNPILMGFYLAMPPEK